MRAAHSGRLANGFALLSFELGTDLLATNT